jgi:hypothetical protein
MISSVRNGGARLARTVDGEAVILAVFSPRQKSGKHPIPEASPPVMAGRLRKGGEIPPAILPSAAGLPQKSRRRGDRRWRVRVAGPTGPPRTGDRVSPSGGEDLVPGRRPWFLPVCCGRVSSSGCVCRRRPWCACARRLFPDPGRNPEMRVARQPASGRRNLRYRESGVSWQLYPERCCRRSVWNRAADSGSISPDCGYGE